MDKLFLPDPITPEQAYEEAKRDRDASQAFIDGHVEYLMAENERLKSEIEFLQVLQGVN